MVVVVKKCATCDDEQCQPIGRRSTDEALAAAQLGKTFLKGTTRKERQQQQQLEKDWAQVTLAVAAAAAAAAVVACLHCHFCRCLHVCQPLTVSESLKVQIDKPRNSATKLTV